MRYLLAAVAASLALATTAAAQTGPCPNTPIDQVAISPTHGCFHVPPQHAAVEVVTGQPIINRYEILWFADGVDVATGQPVQRASIGKPAPLGDGTVWFPLPAYPIGQRFRTSAASISTLASIPVAGREVRSTQSNPFGVPAATPPDAPTAHRVR